MTNATLLLKNASLIDGSGAPPFSGDILIVADQIAEIGKFQADSNIQVLNCTGLTAAPGFIDAHSHSDLQVLQGRMEKTRQGVTSEVVGNCGFSPFPMKHRADALHQFANGILCGDNRWGWASAKEYLDVLSYAPNANVTSLIGHGSMRVEIAGNEQRPLTVEELHRMEGMLDEALTAGAAGLSTGLMYAPGSCAQIEEVDRLCRVVARHDKIYATHMRSYSFGLEEAVEEQLELARRSGCRLQISHLQAVGRSNWPKQNRVLESIERAFQNGVDVAFDCYPYIAGNTTLSQLIPQWSLDGGIERLKARLLDTKVRRRIVEESCASMPFAWDDVILTSVESENNQAIVGMSLAAIADMRMQSPEELLMDLILEESGAATMLTFNQSEENMKQVLTHPLSIVITDGLFVSGKPHPRLHGTFPFLLGEICRKQRWLSLHEAIHKVTGRPAERFRLKKRGLLRPGYFADITLFDAEAIDSKASYTRPEIAPVGIHHVLRNGKFIEGISHPSAD